MREASRPANECRVGGRGGEGASARGGGPGVGGVGREPVHAGAGGDGSREAWIQGSVRESLSPHPHPSHPFPHPRGAPAGEEKERAYAAQRVYDQGNCSPDNMRPTVNAIPVSTSLRSRWQLPLGVIVHPMADESKVGAAGRGWWCQLQQGWAALWSDVEAMRAGRQAGRDVAAELCTSIAASFSPSLSPPTPPPPSPHPHPTPTCRGARCRSSPWAPRALCAAGAAAPT